MHLPIRKQLYLSRNSLAGSEFFIISFRHNKSEIKVIRTRLWIPTITLYEVIRQIFIMK